MAGKDYEIQISGKMSIRFSEQSASMLDQMPDFDFKDFSEWMVNNGVSVGSGKLLEYLMEKRRKNGGS